MSVLNSNTSGGDILTWLYRAGLIAMAIWVVSTVRDLDKSFDTFAATTGLTLLNHEERIDTIELRIRK